VLAGFALPTADPGRRPRGLARRPLGPGAGLGRRHGRPQLAPV